MLKAAEMISAAFSVFGKLLVRATLYRLTGLIFCLNITPYLTVGYS